MVEDVNDTSSIAGRTADRVKEHAGDAADKLKGIGAQASSSAQDLGDKATGLLGTAKTMASNAGDKVNDAFEGQKAAGAKKVKGISSAIRRAADELEGEVPSAATYIRRAADEIDMLTDSVERRDVRQMLSDVQSFAKRQPAAFLGATVLGGFAVMRLLRTPTAAHDASGGLGVLDRDRSLVVAGGSSPMDNASIKGGSGDRGGIAPQAPGFDVTPGTGTLGRGTR